jgi:hypothetical protein
VALLTEISPADEPSTVRSHRRCSRKGQPVGRIDHLGAHAARNARRASDDLRR